MGSLPPGFRFHPTDEELVGYYLKRKVEGQKIELEVIPVIDFYKYDPWELPEKSFLPSRDMEWFFFCPRDKKYPNGLRTNRATRAGYWKATGKDRKVVSKSSVIGYRKTLVFYQGRAPLGDRTKWMMHEYRLCDEHSQGSTSFKGAFALCRVVMKTGAKLSSTDSTGKLNHKRVDSGPSKMDLAPSKTTNEHLISVSSESICHSQYNQSAYSTPISSPYNPTQMGELNAYSTRPNSSNVWISPELILDSSKEYSQVQEAVSNCLPEDQCQQTTFSWQPCGQQDISRSSSYSNFNGEIEHVDDLSCIGNMSPYLSNVDYMGYYVNEYIQYGCYEQIDSYTALF